jgi:hypothetical protein
MADVSTEFKPQGVSFHFGLLADELLERVRSWAETLSRQRRSKKPLRPPSCEQPRRFVAS